MVAVSPSIGAGIDANLSNGIDHKTFTIQYDGVITVEAQTARYLVADIENVLSSGAMAEHIRVLVENHAELTIGVTDVDRSCRLLGSIGINLNLK